MSFDDLPHLPPLLNPGAAEYAARCMAATRLVQKNTKVLVDCRYGSDYWQKLDVYLPAAAGASSLPCLVFFHGGAWINGTKEWMGFMAPPILSAPAIFVAANYRLAPAVKHPALVEDCLDALAWVRARLAQWGGDPDRLFVGGHSAGGHLAALAVLDRARAQAHGLPAQAVRGCLAVSAPFDLRGARATAASQKAYEALLATPQDAASASPIAFVDDQAPPFFIAWGDGDFPALMNQAPAMAEALRSHGRVVRTLQIAGADHFRANEVCADPHGDWARLAMRWLAGSID
ncbi:alpha/beta hydrolase [Vineibacter terrae]|uniref:alpha/beta hydrolase n=1 Tax=Vineibacter terrae TaxID=2586908 RepID=UPI002E318B7E|nr:alpha/beta hydrolase [Vineibacter terrae]HEX2889490.1 alpha/beta hydrolase [Vineibacter terrae]